ncbi:hypoxanthine-guanine phosphoribosyltransferase [Marinimicrobium locisalis]|uniref:hypoxanthine-guanine phosphoribosyltransferase n=1 Tax=Marinimicrobium locisalis TaxID=546022 RepID=UPI003221652A
MKSSEVLQEATCLHDQASLHHALDRLATDIERTLTGEDPLLVLTVMNGGLVTAGQLLTRLPMALETDYIHASRYGQATEGGALRWVHRPETPLKGRRVLVVDDILDRGLTLSALVDYVRREGARSVHTVALVQKALAQPPAVEADFVGLTVPDRFVFGFGMDWRGLWRNAPGIYIAPE